MGFERAASLRRIKPRRKAGPLARRVDADLPWLARLGGRTGGVDLVNDALLFLQAREMGCALLTANLRDFDLFQQVLPGSSLLLYRTP